MPTYFPFDIYNYLSSNVLANLGPFQENEEGHFEATWKSKPTIFYPNDGGEFSIDLAIKLHFKTTGKKNNTFKLKENLVLVPVISWDINMKFLNHRIQHFSYGGTQTSTNNLNQMFYAFTMGRYRDFSTNLLVNLNDSLPCRLNFITYADLYTKNKSWGFTSYTPKASLCLAYDTELGQFKYVLLNYTKNVLKKVSEVEILDPNQFMNGDYYLKGFDYDHQYKPVKEIIQNGLATVFQHLMSNLLNRVSNISNIKGDYQKMLSNPRFMNLIGPPSTQPPKEILKPIGYDPQYQSDPDPEMETEVNQSELEFDGIITVFKDHQNALKKMSALAMDGGEFSPAQTTLFNYLDKEEVINYAKDEKEKGGWSGHLMKMLIRKFNKSS